MIDMNAWQLTPAFPVYLLAILIAAFSAVLGWRMRPARGATYFSFMVMGVTIWSLGYLLGFFNTNLEWKLAMLRVEYFGMVSSIYFWIPFVITFVQYDRWLTKKIMILLAVVPVITFVQILFIKQHNFFYQSYQLAHLNGLVRFSKVYNVGFYFWILYVYMNLIIGSFLLIWGVLHQSTFFRRQNLLIVVLIVIIMVPNSLYVSGLKPLGPYDPTPLTFVLAGILFMILLWKYKLFDIVPVAHHRVFKDVRTGVIVIDIKNRILDMNPPSENIIGKTQKDVLGIPISEVIPALSSFLEKHQSSPDLKTELILDEGNRIFEVQKSPLVNNKNNKTIGYIIMLYEITALKQALDELNAFAHSVAHDLKSPLAEQWIRIELLKSGDLEENEVEESYDAIGQAANKMISIVDALILLADVRKKTTVQYNSIDMGKVVSNALDRLENFVNQNNAQIIQPDQWPAVKGYAPWIEEVWVNYINNALKYGGKPPVVQIGADVKNDHILFWVKDNGEGLSKEEIDSLFKEFQRLQRHAKDTAGHGLGLSVVSRIINKLGGDVGVMSDGKSGSTFYFTLKN